MSDYQVAYRYAKSLFELSEEKGKEEEILEDMKLVDAVMNENRQLVMVMKQPLVPHFKKFTILKQIFDGKVQSMTLRFFELMTHKHRESLVDDVARTYIELYRERHGIGIARLVSAIPLSSELKKEFIKISKEVSNKRTIELEEKVDDSIIGGFVLTVDDKQIDQSVHTKLAKLRTALS